MQYENEVFFTRVNASSLNFSEGAIKVRETGESSGYGVRAISDSRVGFAYCTKESEIEAAIEKAAALSKHSPKTKFSFTPKRKEEKVGCIDPKIAQNDISLLKDALEQAQGAIEKSGAKARISISSSTGEVAIRNSAGADSSYKKTGFALYAEAMKGEGYGYAYHSSCFLPKEDFHSFGERALEMAKGMETAGPAEQGEYTAVFSAEALGSLVEIMLPSFSGDWKRKGITRLEKMQGKKIFDERVSIYDDALSMASSCAPIDDEGVPSRRIPLAEKGIMRNFLFDRESAALAGEEREGSCSREDYDAPPHSSSSNIVIGTGEYKNFEEELKDFLLVESLHGTHTANTTTGDFGAEVNVAFFYSKGGKKAKKGFMVSGNVFDMFNNVLAIEKTTHTNGNIIAPRIAFEKVAVTS